MRRSFWIFLTLLSLSLQAQDTTRLSLLFVGDIMQHDSNIAAAYDPVNKKYDYTSCFQWIAPTLRSADITIGNLELTLAGAPYKGYPQFSAPDALAVALKDVGFDVLVTANNHCVDRGRKGLERTVKVLDSLKIRHTGTFVDSIERDRNHPLIVSRNGFSLSLLNYTYGTNGLPIVKPTKVNLIDTAAIARDLQKVKKQNTDAIIVFFHWGAEYQSFPNAFQKTLADWCLQRGAKLVIGAHPHVLQPMEWRKKKDQLVAYSLGNFISGQRPRLRDGGLMLWVDLEKVEQDSTSATKIKHAEFDLEWMYKTPGTEKFYSLPLPAFENDTTFVKEKSMRDALRVFKEDSRSLLGKHNVEVAERIDKGAFFYRIELIPFEPLAGNPFSDFFSIESDPWDSEKYWTGKFYDVESAEQALSELLTKIPAKASAIRKFIDR